VLPWRGARSRDGWGADVRARIRSRFLPALGFFQRSWALRVGTFTNHDLMLDLTDRHRCIRQAMGDSERCLRSSGDERRDVDTPDLLASLAGPVPRGGTLGLTGRPLVQVRRGFVIARGTGPCLKQR
jgi:hypothetical protein